MNVLETMIGWLAPPICIGCCAEGSALCFMCATSEILPFGEKCWSCGRISLRSQTCPACKRRGSANFVWITTDYEGLARLLIREYKFKHNRSAALPIADLMNKTFLSFNSDADIKTKDYLVVPIPTATNRVRQRGFDHTGLLAKNLAHTLRLNSKQVLKRHGQSRQTGAKRTDRLAQIKGKFSVSTPNSIKGRHILLVDDVITTGATVSEAAKTLRRAGARSVSALIFAKRL